MVDSIARLGLMAKRIDRSIEIRRLRKMLAEDGADPFLVAAIALETVGRYGKKIEELRAELGRRPAPKQPLRVQPSEASCC